mmetsp:Transcript_46053/g.51979  ORF Transcript_46053/g.51979 Transcript_46053/m.51979 type:complete len:677 (-) Transcript_46053:190-2220(-)
MRGKIPLRRSLTLSRAKHKGLRGRRSSTSALKVETPTSTSTPTLTSTSTSTESPSLSSSTINKNAQKILSKAAKARKKSSIDDDDDDTSSSDDDDDNHNNNNHQNTGENIFFCRSDSNSRFDFQRTWSVNAFSTSNHSIGNHSVGDVYLDDSDNTDSSESEFAFDDGDVKDDTGNITSAKKKKKSKQSNCRPNRRGRRKDHQKMNVTSEIILECDEEKDEDEEEKNNNEEEVNDDDDKNNSNDDDYSASYGYNIPGTSTMGRRTSMLSSTMATAISNNDNVDMMIDSGYSSDSALVRRRMETIQKQHKEAQRQQGNKRATEGGKKKKKKSKNKNKSKKKDKKKAKKNGKPGSSTTLSSCGDSVVTTNSSEDDDFIFLKKDDVDDGDNTVSKKKKKKKKMKSVGKKEMDTKDDNVTSNNFGDTGYHNYDKRLEELEKLEWKVSEERGLLQKEREVMAFERESIEMQLNEEFHKCDDLTVRVRELEQVVQSNKLSNAGNNAESIDVKEIMKVRYEKEKDDLKKQLFDKDTEIENLKRTAKDLKILQDTNNNNDTNVTDFNSANIADNGKSRERLLGELLQTVAKLTSKESQLKQQTKELDLAQEELDSLRDGKQMTQLKNSLSSIQLEMKELKQELYKERTEKTTKLKEKDETITFLMNELASLKQAQSISSPRPMMR